MGRMLLRWSGFSWLSLDSKNCSNSDRNSSNGSVPRLSNLTHLSVVRRFLVRRVVVRRASVVLLGRRRAGRRRARRRARGSDLVQRVALGLVVLHRGRPAAEARGSFGKL